MRGNPAPLRIAISGTGFVARGLARLLAADPARWRLGPVLTRRDPARVAGLDGLALTTDPEAGAAGCDILVECSGTVGGAARAVAAALDRGLPVLTMNAEFQVTLGAAFAGRGPVLEAAGDQPGCLAALDREVRDMGFRPLVYGSQKGFLNHHPAPAEMDYWARRQGISLPAVTAFTDGSKVQVEAALVADALGAGIARRGLVGPRAAVLAEGAERLAALATGGPLADYVLQPGGRGEVFILAAHDNAGAELAYYKLGRGPHYLIVRPFHLGHFEIPGSLRALAEGRTEGLLRASPQPRHTVLAVAKRDLAAGTEVARGMGSFLLRGEAARRAEHPGHLPLGLVENARLRRPVAAGQVLGLEDVELADPAALRLWQGGCTARVSALRPARPRPAG